MKKLLSSVLIAILCLLPFVSDAWVLKDEFTTPVAADAVHGTSAEPIGGTRTVVDTYKTTELLTNGGFETCDGCTANDDADDNFGTWIESQSEGKIDWRSDDVHGGSYSIKITRDTGATYLTQIFTVIPNKSYVLSFWTKGDGTNYGKYRIHDVTNSTDIQTEVSTGVTAATWTQVSRTFDTPSGCVQVRVYFVGSSVNGTSILYDDVSVLPTSGLLSIADGKLTFAGGKASATSGDPGIWWGAQTRAAGMTMLMQVTPTVGTTIGEFGFDTNQSGAIAGSGMRLSSATLLPYDGSTAGPSVFVPVTATDYKKAITLRSAGAYYFLKGGTQSNWSLLWFNSTNNTATLYPSISGYSLVSTRDFARVPTRTFLPTPLAYDTFTRSNGAIGTSETSGPDSQTTPAKTWTGATWTIDTNKAINTPVPGAEIATGNTTVGTWYLITADEGGHFYTGSAANDNWLCTEAKALDASNKVKPLTLTELQASVSTSTKDVVTSIDIVRTAGKQAGLITNLDSASTYGNFLVATASGTADASQVCTLWAKNTSGYTSIVSGTCAYSSGAKLVVIKDGDTVDLYHNNAKIGGAANNIQAYTTIVNNTLHGLFSTYEGNTFDNYTLFPRGNDGEYAALNTLMSGSSGGSLNLLWVGR